MAGSGDTLGVVRYSLRSRAAKRSSEGCLLFERSLSPGQLTTDHMARI
jgi:hypothetical protein